MRFTNDPVFSSTTLDSSTTKNSNPVIANYKLAVSLQAVVTGTAVGNLKLQASNDSSTINPPAPVNWSDIPSATVAIAGAGTYLIPKTEIAYQWIRAVYVPSAGNGSLSANLEAIAPS